MSRAVFIQATVALAGALGIALTGCRTTTATPPPIRPGSFADDLVFLKQHVDVIVLSSVSGQAQVAVVPAYQGRVMTSTSGGDDGDSYGWINRKLIASGEIRPHINVYGGEDRFWLGPEGGQFAIYFARKAPFDLQHWQTPAVIDTEPFEVVSRSRASATFARKARLENWSGTVFDIAIERTVRLAATMPGVSIPDAVRMVAFETENTLRNVGARPWTQDTGLLSIWILGMFRPSDNMTIVIPFKPGPESELGPKVNDNYFGKVPTNRLLVEDDVLFFKGDGRHRGKIGLSPRRATEVAGSYDAGRRLLTLVTYTKPEGATDYVNSMWDLQEAPFSGDVINSYNDGPPAPGREPLGPFYELETSSPAAALKPGESITHVHRTFHFQGTEPDLDKIARQVLGVGLADIAAAFDQ